MSAQFHTNKINNPTPKADKAAETMEEKTFRCRIELIEAGMSKYGLRKFNTHYLPKLIQDGEHIEAVVYGRYAEGPGFLSWTDRMIVATNRRVISVNHKPGYTDFDEFTYDVINGVETTSAGFFTGVSLTTKIHELRVRFVNKKCARKFVHFIEKRRIEYYEDTKRININSFGL
jgi:hypothetical protein